MNKYEEAAYAHVPEGVEVKLRKAYTGRANFRENILVSPAPKGARSCAIFFHEIAHFELHDPDAPGCRRKPRYVEEYEAERWAIDKMRECGLKVTNKVVYACKSHVRYAIYKGLRRGLRHVDRDIARWSGVDMENVTRWEEKNK